MESLRDIIASNGGLECLAEHSPIQLELDPRNFIQVADAGESPHGLQAVSLAFFHREEGRRKLSGRMFFEITDLGFLPYYMLNNLEGVEMRVYSLNRKKRIRRTNLETRRFLVGIAAKWDEQLTVSLPFGGGIVQT